MTYESTDSMKKKVARSKKSAISKATANGLGVLVTDVRNLIQSARQAAATVVNTIQVRTNFEIGRRIVEHEQKGAKRAAYGAELLKDLSLRLTTEFGKGFSERNLDYMRKFFLTWRDRIEQAQSSESMAEPISQQPVAKFREAFSLGWTHYLVLLPIKDPGERSFYEIEANRRVLEVVNDRSTCPCRVGRLRQ